MPRSKNESHRRKSSRQISVDNKNNFVFKLYNILNNNLYPCLHWSEDGTAVVIESALDVERHVLPNHFETVKFYSFTRQFHLYGFERTTDGRKKKEPCGSCKFQHPNFQSGHPEVLQYISRIQLPKNQTNSLDSRVKSTSARERTAPFNPTMSTQIPSSAFKLVPAPAPPSALVSAISAIAIAPNTSTTGGAAGSSTISIGEKWFQPDMSNPLISAPPMSASQINVGPSGFSPNAVVPILAAEQTMGPAAPVITPGAITDAPNHVEARQMEADLRSPESGPICNALQLLEDSIESLKTDELTFLITQLDVLSKRADNTIHLRRLEKQRQKSNSTLLSALPAFRKQAPAGLQLQPPSDVSKHNLFLHSPGIIQSSPVGGMPAISPVTQIGSASIVIPTGVIPDLIAPAAGPSVPITTLHKEGVSPAWPHTHVNQVVLYPTPMEATMSATGQVSTTIAPAHSSLPSALYFVASDNLAHMSTSRAFVGGHHAHHHSLDSSQAFVKGSALEQNQTSPLYPASHDQNPFTPYRGAYMPTLSEAAEPFGVFSPISEGFPTSSISPATALSDIPIICQPPSVASIVYSQPAAVGAAMHPMDIPSSSGMLLPLASSLGNAGSPISDAAMLSPTTITTTGDWPMSESSVVTAAAPNSGEDFSSSGFGGAYQL